MKFFFVRQNSGEVQFVPYLLVFSKSSLCSAEVCLQLFPPVLFLCQTGLQKSEPLLAAVPEVLLYISDDTESLQEGADRKGVIC